LENARAISPTKDAYTVVRWRSDESMMQQSPRCRIVLFYHRDTRNKFHGEAVYVRQFIQRFRDDFELAALSPGEGALDPPRFSGILNDAIVTCLVQFRALGSIKMLLPRGRASVVVVADVYFYVVPLLIARIRRVPLVFLCSDLPGRYAASWSDAQKGLSVAMKIIRTVLDRLTFASCDAVVVRTESMQSSIAANPRLKHLPVWIAHHLPVRQPVDRTQTLALLSELNLQSSRLLVFVGDCHYPPNATAVDFILQELAPAVSNVMPDVCFVIAGPGSELWKGRDPPNVRIMGRVDDLSSLLYAAHIGLAPIGVEGGVSSKVIDYLAHGLIVIATPEAAVGQIPSTRLRVSPLPEFRQTLVHTLQSERVIRALDRTGLSEGPDSRTPVTGDESWVQLAQEIHRIAFAREDLRRSGPPPSGKARAPPRG
jgi:glycosyltransferase involved in cell wall biosynthesis